MIKTLDDVKQYRKLLPPSLDYDGNPVNYDTAVWCSRNQDGLYDYAEGTFLGDVYQLLRNTTSDEDRVEIWHFWLDVVDLDDEESALAKRSMGYEGEG